MVNESLNLFLSKAGRFSNEYISDLEKRVHQGIYRSKQVILAAGQIEMNLYLIEKGFARSYYFDKNGMEHTVKFWSAGELLFSYEGYYKVPSFYYTEFMETSQAIAMSYSDLADIDRKYPETTLLIKYALLKNRNEEYERQNILTLPAVERYKNLIDHKAVIFQKSPVKYIASYLNMSRETLARLMGKH